MTSAESASSSPQSPADAALANAVAAEHATIYGYGFVSAHSTSGVNALVEESLNEHRRLRDAAIAMLAARSVTAPVAAAGYQLPISVSNANDAAALAVRMESDDATAWRAVVEQATTEGDRTFGVTAMTQCAVLAAKWRQVLGAWPPTVPFPGGNER